MALSSEILSIVLIIAIGNLVMMMSEASPPEKSCRAVHTDLNRLKFTEMSLCYKSPDYHSAKERVQKSFCILKCALEGMGLLNPAGVLSTEQYNHYLKENFPESLQNRANSTFSPCLKFLGFNSTDGAVEKDVLCNSYKPYIKCISTSTLRLCSGLN